VSELSSSQRIIFEISLKSFDEGVIDFDLIVMS
jgi:hypothetical protein